MNNEMIAGPSCLEGTGYIEILPAAFNGVYWQQGSLFFTERGFELIEHVLAEQNGGAFDRFAVTEMPSEKWHSVAADCRRLAEAVRQAADVAALNDLFGFALITDEAALAERRKEVAGMLEDFAGWLARQVPQTPVISVLGL